MLISQAAPSLPSFHTQLLPRQVRSKDRNCKPAALLTAIFCASPSQPIWTPFRDQQRAFCFPTSFQASRVLYCPSVILWKLTKPQTESAKCGHLALLCALELAHCPVSVPEILGPHLCPAGFPNCPSPLWVPVNLCYKLQSGLPLPRPTGVPQRWKLHSLCGPLLTSTRDSHAAHHCHCTTATRCASP